MDLGPRRACRGSRGRWRRRLGPRSRCGRGTRASARAPRRGGRRRAVPRRAATRAPPRFCAEREERASRAVAKNVARSEW